MRPYREHDDGALWNRVRDFLGNMGIAIDVVPEWRHREGMRVTFYSATMNVSVYDYVPPGKVTEVTISSPESDD